MADDRAPMWVICSNKHSGLAWSNTYGWVKDDSYDLFTDEERQTLSLPMGGRWVRLP